MKPKLIAMLTVLTLSPLAAHETLDLGGTWKVSLDPQNTGVEQRWFAREMTAPITLPGSVQEARMGDPITVDTKWVGGVRDRSYFTANRYAPYRQPGNIKVPFWLQPDTSYIGAAWYQREIDVPASWTGKRVVLSLERPHWKTTVWLGERELGSNDSLSTPHACELGVAGRDLAIGKHRLTVRVDNTHNPDIGENSHSISDHTQGNWNGITGRIELIATATAWVEELQVFPDTAKRAVSVKGRVAIAPGAAMPETVSLTPGANAKTTAAKLGRDGTFGATLALAADAALWDEFNPALHRLTAEIAGGERREAVFGLRDFTADGRQLKINGRPVFLRGTLDCAAYPRTGHPPMDVATWEHVLGIIKAHGLNHVRFHSWCPPEAAFVAADKMGVYLQVEVNTWPKYSTTLGDGKPVEDWIDRETARILRAYGNHPSFVMLCAGNEPGGPRHPQWLAGWLNRQKKTDSRRLYTAGAGWPEIPENDYHVPPEPRIHRWGEGLGSRINARAPETVTDYNDYIRARTAPVVSHEIGQWCVYPNFDEIRKYTGYLKAKNFEIFRESLEAHGMAAQAHDFLIASGKLQALCYKEDIESALRTPQMGGFQLLGLNDFPGQGTALVGVLDAFWEEKGYISPAGFSRFCNSTVPLALLDKRVFTTGEHLSARAKIAHYGDKPLANASVAWQLIADDGSVAAAGGLAPQNPIAPGLGDLGRIDLPLEKVPAPARYKLALEVRAGAAVFTNDWDVWVYPQAEQVAGTVPDNVMLTQSFNAAAQKKLAEGGAVVLVIPPSKVAPDAKKGPVALGFSSIFWNTSWTQGQAPHTLGILCDPKSPALAAFPTDPWSNWQWWHPVTNAAPMILDALPRELTPTVQVIDDWFTNRKLALVFEARVGRGRLLVTSIDITDAVLDPVRRQLRASLLAYTASPAFQPAVSITKLQLQSLFAKK